MYRISLANFEGPFDLLLFLIKRDELNIYDIPIFKITGEFLKYIQLIQLFDLELAGEFLVMASTLMQIKTQMLLPKSERDDAEIEDPTTDLAERLLEYKQFKAAASELSEKAEEQRYVYYRRLFEGDYETAGESSGYNNASIFDLLKAFKDVLERKNKETISHVITMVNVTVDEKALFIMETLRQKPRVSFNEITKNDDRQGVIVTFIAILELIKLQKIFVRQNGLFRNITIAPTTVLK